MERFLPRLRMPLAGLWTTLLFLFVNLAAMAQQPFITTWKTNNPGESITIPVNPDVSGYNYTVNWGDGSPVTNHANEDAIHTYATADTYTVSISGSFPAIHLGSYGIEVSDKLVSIEQWGNIAWTSMDGAFSGARYMVNNATDVPNLSNVSSLSRMFFGAEAFNGDLSGWNVSAVTDMSSMFYSAFAFNGNVSNWDVSNVTNMQGMFWQASVFNQDIGGWNVSNVADMSFMFYSAVDFNQDLSGWTTSNVTTMTQMFAFVLGFDQSLGSWDISKVTDMEGMFSGISNLSPENYSATLVGWAPQSLQSGVILDAPNLTYCPGTEVANAIQQLENKGWTINDAGEAADCDGGDIGPADPDHFITIWKSDIDAGTGPYDIKIPAEGEFSYTYVNTTNPAVTGSGSGNGETIITFPEPGTYEVRIAPTGSNPFHAISLHYRFVGNDAYKLLEVKNWGTVHWSRFQFYGCENLKVTATDIPDLSGLTNLSFAFSGSGIDEIPNINDWDVSTVTDLSNLFEDVTGFNQSLSDWDVSNVTNMTFMFDGASSFNQPLDSWDVRKLENFGYMFRDAASFNQSLGAWQLESLGGMIGAFARSGMSCENYSYSLYGWATYSNTSSEVIADPGQTPYSPDVASYRDFLENSLNWNFQGDNVVGTCTVTLPSTPVTPGPGNILYVDQNVSGGTGAGDSWANAVPELADALKWAREQHDGGSPDWDDTNPLRIFVAKGTYKPLYHAGDGAYTTDGGRDNSFVLVPDVQLYGGFDPAAGVETLDDARILPHMNSLEQGSILSGDFNDDDHMDNYGNHTENAHHVTVASGDVGLALMDGFTVTGGYASGNTSGPSVFGRTVYRFFGGGTYIVSSSPQFTHMAWFNNYGARGGGMYNSVSLTTEISFPKLSNVTFYRNMAPGGGGGIRNFSGSVDIQQAVFAENGAGLVEDLTSFGPGGGIHTSGDGTSLSVTNATFYRNWIVGVFLTDYTGGAIYVEKTTTQLNNVVVWGNEVDGDPDDPSASISILTALGADVTISNSLVAHSGGSADWNNTMGIVDGGGNIDTDPLFASTTPGEADYLRLTADSPALNAGSNTLYTDAGGDLANDLDLAGNPRVYAGIPDPDYIDMGAYEFQGEPAMHIVIETWSGDSFTLDADAGDSIQQIKKKIEDEKDIPADQQVLRFGGLRLEEGLTLADYGIESGDVLQLALAIAPNNGIVYVDVNVNTDAPGYTGVGDSWENAAPELADALKWAREQHDGGSPGWSETDPLQIFVAVGTYKPLYSALDEEYTTDGGRYNSFVLVPDVQLYGGFNPGAGIETLDDERILPDRLGTATGTTILDGDLQGDDASDIPIRELHSHLTRLDNAHHVVVSAGDVGVALINGFTIVNGNAAGLVELAPVVTVYSKVIYNGDNGGGLLTNYSSPQVSHSLFIGNSATRSGGAVDTYRSTAPQFDQVIITGNWAAYSGGGMSVDQSGTVIKNSLFAGNESISVGGVFLTYGASLSNTTLFGNRADQTAGGLHLAENTGNVSNLIIWGNSIGGDTDLVTASIAAHTEGGDIPTVSNSLIANSGGSETWGINLVNDGGGNIDTDPLFVSTTPGEAGYLQLSACSPAISAGSNQAYTDAGGNLAGDLDLAGNPRVYDQAGGGVIDMGAYEYQGFVQSLTTPDAVPVAYGTALEDVEGLPTAVTATLSDDTDVSIPLDGNLDNWTLLTPAGGSYDGDVAGTYVFAVPLLIPETECLLNPEELQAEVTVTVAKGTPVLHILWDGAETNGGVGLSLTYGDVGTLTFGTTDPDGTITYAFGVDDAPVLDLADLSAVAAQQTGTATLTIEQEETDNYEAASLSIPVTVAQKEVTIVPTADQGKVYGAAEPAAYGYELAAGDALALDDELTDIVSAATRETGEDVGLYDIELVFGGAQAGNYTITFEPDNDAFAVTPLEITVTAEDKTKVFGGADPALTYTFAPALIDDDEFTGSLDRDAGEDVGDYAITQGDLSLGSNYTLTFEAGMLTITPAGYESVELNDLTATYDGTEHGLTLAGELPAGASVAYEIDGEPGNSATDAGSFEVTATIDGGANYDDAVLMATLTITPLEITVTAEDKSKVFGSDDPALTYTFTPELVGDDEFAGALTRDTGEDVGDYAITQGDLSLGDNYTLTFETGTLTVTSASYEGVELNDLAVTYNGTAHTLALTGELPAGASVAYEIDGAAGNSATDAGNYEVTATIDGGANYDDAVLAATLTITPLEIAVTAEDQTKVFGSDDPALTYTFAPELIGNDEFTGSLDRDAGEDVGDYAITQGDLSLDGNYILTFEAGTLAVTPEAITGITLNDISFTYDGAEHRLTLAGELPAGASVAYEIDGEAGNGATDAGSYEVTARIDGGANYDDAVLAATLTITPLEITVTAEDKSKVFGSDDPALTYTYNPELIGDDEFMGSLDRDAGEDVGDYAITQGDLSLDGNYALTFEAATLAVTSASYEGVELNDLAVTYDGTEHRLELTGELPEGVTVSYAIDGEPGNGATDAGGYEVTAIIDGGDNYEDAELTATLTITPLEITVTAEDKSKAFGADDPALTYASTPELVGGGAFTGGPEREEGEAVGDYAITRGNLSAGGNYEITFETGTLTITPAAISGITLNNTSSTYDGTEHRLSLAGDLPAGASVTYEIDSEPGNGATDAGTYEVIAYIDGGANYEEVELTATLTITPVGITVTALDQTKAFGADDPALTYTFTPALIGEDVFDGSLARDEGEAVGNYTITQGDLALGGNYSIDFEAGELTITQRQLSEIVFENTSFTYDGTEHTLTLAGDLPAGASVTYENNGRTNVGNQTVRAFIDGGGNYQDEVLDAILTVVPAARTLDFPALPEKTYGDAGFYARATASSGEVISYTSSNPDVADVSADGEITITGAGETTITATVPENANYSSRPQVSQPLTVEKTTQTITLDGPAEVNRDAGSIELTASSTSGLPVVLTADNNEVATLDGTTLSILRLGRITITAAQAGDANHEAAEPVTLTIRVIDPTSDLPVRVHPVISPNGDGINEFLMIEAVTDYPENRVTIFNRNGTLLWEASGYDNNRVAFRGMSTGQLLLPAGTYFYIVEVKDGNTWKHKKGYFVLRY